MRRYFTAGFTLLSSSARNSSYIFCSNAGEGKERKCPVVVSECGDTAYVSKALGNEQ
jgi:hypothetical protein